MKEAAFYEKLDDGNVLCTLCPHRCRVAPDERGICSVRENRGGELVSLVYGRLAAGHVDPIEKKPLFHFLPGSKAYSVATVGCNLSCPFCQNHDLSLAWRGKVKIGGYEASPEEIVSEAARCGCDSICFTYSEPTIFFEYMRDIASLALERGLRNTVVSNGFIEPGPLRELLPLIHGANIDLKAFREETYRKVLKARLGPVMDTIRALHEGNVWTEVTTLVIPGMNDSEEELAETAGFIAGVSEDLPWHVSRFHPTYRWPEEQGATPVETLRLALEKGRQAGLKYVFSGNVPGEPSESTECPSCGAPVIERYGFTVTGTRLKPGGFCAECGEQIAGVFE